ncbi:MAG: hypothetical protein NTW26_07670 [bacterium]|nr:hypothetical protein [bacterium]
MRIGWIIIFPLFLATFAAAADTQPLPDPFLDGLFMEALPLQVKTALEENGWETTDDWSDIYNNPLYKIHGRQDNRTLIYQYDVYGRLTFMSYLEQWPSIAGCKKAYKIWYDWLKMYYGEPVEEDEHFAHWSNSGYEIKLFDKTYISGESSMPTTMVNIYQLRIL